MFAYSCVHIVNFSYKVSWTVWLLLPQIACLLASLTVLKKTAGGNLKLQECIRLLLIGTTVVCLEIMIGREIQELGSHRPTRSLVLIVQADWNKYIQVV